MLSEVISIVEFHKIVEALQEVRASRRAIKALYKGCRQAYSEVSSTRPARLLTTDTRCGPWRFSRIGSSIEDVIVEAPYVGAPAA